MLKHIMLPSYFNVKSLILSHLGWKAPSLCQGGICLRTLMWRTNHCESCSCFKIIYPFCSGDIRTHLHLHQRALLGFEWHHCRFIMGLKFDILQNQSWESFFSMSHTLAFYIQWDPLNCWIWNTFPPLFLLEGLFKLHQIRQGIPSLIPR